MHLFSPSRPRLPNGRPALLLEGSAVPVVSVVPRESGSLDQIDLVLYLRNFDESAERAYSYRNKTIETLQLYAFFADYIANPEATLLRYFDWKDQTTTTRHKAVPRPHSSTVLEALDLL